MQPTLVSHNLRGLEEKAAMLQIQHLSLQSILHNIHQSQFICKLLYRKKQYETITLNAGHNFCIKMRSH